MLQRLRMRDRFLFSPALSFGLTLGLFLILCFSGPLLGSEQKTIARIADPVVVNNAILKGRFSKVSIREMCVLVYRNREFDIIPYQIDERGPEGELILTQGQLKGKQRDKEGNYGEANSLGVFNKRDEIVFLARDMGDRAPPGKWPKDAERAVEIQASDPLNGGLAWAYLASFSKPPVPAGQDYIAYNTLEKKRNKPEVHILAERYHAGFTDLSKPVAQSDWHIKKGSWEGKDIMKTFRSMIDIRLGFIHFDFTLENIIPKRLGQIDGPVRVVRRIRNSVRFAGIPIPDFLMKKLAGAALDTDSFYYPDYFYFTGKLSMPHVVVKYGKKSKAIFTTDFNANTAGMYWTDQKNQVTACIVDGVMSPQEHALDDGLYRWSLLHGEQGGWMNILTFEEGFRDLDIRLYYMDNEVDGTLPEGDPPLKGYASTGYRVKDFQKIQKGKPLVFTTNLFAIDPTFKKGDEAAYVNLIFHPLQISLTGVKEP